MLGCMIKAVRSLLRSIPHLVFASFVLVLPVGYYPDDPDSAEFVVGVHEGYGQMASVIRDCSGQALHAEGSSFLDVSGSAYITLPPRNRSPWVLGLRGGYWHSKAAKAESHTSGYPDYIVTYGRSPEHHISFSYLNPNLSYETKYIGLGIGYMFSGNIPFRFEEWEPHEHPLHPPRPHEVPVSGHLRLGNRERLYFAASFAESTPLVSGGSFLSVGMGYPSGEHTRLSTGLSIGLYDMPGVVQQARFRLSRAFDADVTVRFGQAGGVFEGSLAGGLICRFGVHQR